MVIEVVAAVAALTVGFVVGALVERHRIGSRVRQISDGWDASFREVARVPTGWVPIPKYLNKDQTMTEVDGSFYGNYGSYTSRDL